MSVYEIKLEPLKLPRLKERGFFTEEQVRLLAQNVKTSQLERYARAEDANDQPHKPLSPKYAERKRRKGRRPVRDMRNTGRMLGALDVQEVSTSGFSVGFRAANPFSKRAAHFRNLFDGFFGMSPRNNQELDAALETVFTAQLKEIWAE